MKLFKKSIAVLFAFSVSFPAVSQDAVSNFVRLMEDAPGDASTLANSYLEPYGEMLGTSLNSGWYNSAKVHGLLGFDFTVSLMTAVAPSSAQSFDINELGLNALEVADGESGVTPTLAGEMSELPELQLKGTDQLASTFEMPNGTGFNKLPVPMVQAAVGLPKDIELIGRVVPKMKFGDAGEVSLLGVGVKHSLKGYIPVVKRLPFLQMSVLAGYTSFNSSTSISKNDPISVTDGELAISSGAFTSRLLIGANLPVVAIYTGVGYGSSNSDFDVKGEYMVDGFSESFSDPFALNYKTSGIDFNAGMRIRIGFLALHADYTVGNYSTLTAGVGINIR